MVYPKLLASKENWFLFFDVRDLLDFLSHETKDRRGAWCIGPAMGAIEIYAKCFTVEEAPRLETVTLNLITSFNSCLYAGHPLQPGGVADVGHWEEGMVHQQGLFASFCCVLSDFARASSSLR